MRGGTSKGVFFNLSDLPEVDYSSKANDVIVAISKNVTSLIEDGSTLQLGIGSIPDHVLKNLMAFRQNQWCKPAWQSHA